MNDVLLSPIRLSELETIIQNSVERALKAYQPKQVEKNGDSERLLTVKEAACFLNLSVHTIYSKVSRGELPVMKQGKKLHFSNTELMQYLKNGRKKTYSEIETAAEKYLQKHR